MQFEALADLFRESGFGLWADTLESRSKNWLVDHGDYARWQQAFSQLPELADISCDLNFNAITVNGNCAQPEILTNALRALMPWRKGPFRIAHVYIDSEWRSDSKWSRIKPHLSALQNRRVLDIGCGNGYHCWRMLHEDPVLVLGIDPSVLFNFQFQSLQKYINHPRIHMLPIGIDDLPASMNWFDTVFSMGVFYHRRSPLDHLYQLKDLLVSGGELCLETLVIDGGRGDVLVPQARYARMRNVWFIPSAVELAAWMRRCGFVNVEVVDISTTGIEEQRSTEWMQFESLVDCLDKSNPGLTVEGLPAPKRAVVMATKT